MKKIILLSCLFVMHSCVNGMENKDNSKELAIKLPTEEWINDAMIKYAREKAAIDHYLETYQRNPHESRCSNKLLELMIRERIQSGALIINDEGCLVETQKEVNFLVQACKDAIKPSGIIRYMHTDDTDWLSRHKQRHPRPEPLSSEEIQKILDIINEDKK